VSDVGPVRVELYDTTLRDGAQQADLSYTVEDRLRILHKLDQVGFPYIEGGWPGANPRDSEFFRLATKEPLEHAQLTAFGMTRRAGERAEDSQTLRDLLDAGTEVVCLVGKSWDLHVTEALRTDLDEGVAMVRDSVAFLRAQGRRVFFDAEHFFDGYESDPVFAMAVLGAAEEAGAERLVLCDTNGGMLPVDIARIVTAVKGQASVALGIHVHNDAGCAVANSLVAVDAGVLQVQGTVNGYGERTGNADIVPITADLVLKMGVTDALPEGSVAHLTELAHYVAEIANLPPEPRQPYAGRHAFTHKAGLHTSGVARVARAYEHVEPDAVGNRRNVVASDYSGGASIRMKADEFGLALGDAAIPAAV
jgi:2-isopropylmalate synthase